MRKVTDSQNFAGKAKKYNVNATLLEVNESYEMRLHNKFLVVALSFFIHFFI